MRAYDDDLLWLIQDTFGRMFEICLDDERLSNDEFTGIFLSSDIVKSIEQGCFWFVEGKSATQLAEELLGHRLKSYHEAAYGESYWAGHVYAYVQWRTCRSFKEIFMTFPVEKLVSMYRPYHEADVDKIASEIMSEMYRENRLKHLRKQELLTQEELAKASGISVKTIRAYEQGIISLRNAKGETLFRLSKALHCSMEDLVV